MSRAIHSIAVLLGLLFLSVLAGDPAENTRVDANGSNQDAKDEQATIEALKSRFKRQGLQLDDEIMAAAVEGRKPKPKGMALEVEFQPREYLLAEPVLVRCSLVNYGDAPITLSYGLFAEQKNTIFFDVEGPDGKLAPILLEKLDSPGPQPLVIPARRRYVETYNLVDCYGLTRAGRYKVNVRYESDGRSFNPSSLKWREDLWRGKLEQSLAAMTIVQPTHPADKAALDALRAQAINGPDSPYWFQYLFYAEAPVSFDAFLREHGASRYAAYARYGNARAGLEAARSGAPRYAAAIANLKAIDPTGYPPLFAEQRLFRLIEAHLGADSPPEQVAPLLRSFVSHFPASPYLTWDAPFGRR